MKYFELKTEYIQLNSLLKLIGWVESGGEANCAISEGQVMCNGTIETQKRKKIIKGDVIVFAGQTIGIK